MSLKHKAPNPEKGARYLAQLDAALCNASWSDVPELARKVEKHAPERKCFTLAARTEAQIASALRRPTTASSDPSVSLHGLSEAVPKLREVIAASPSHPEDAYIATTCLAEIAFQQRDCPRALEILSSQAAETSRSTQENASSALGWLEVCSVKSSFIQVMSLEATGKHTEVAAHFSAMSTQTPGYRSPELRKWTERLLGRSCLYSAKKVPGTSLRDLGEAYPAFKCWGEYWSRAPQGSGSHSDMDHLDVPRRAVWRAYYDLLSVVTQQGLFYDTDSEPGIMFRNVAGLALPSDLITASRRRLRIEMKRVETTYESLLLNETTFPKAGGTNVEVEDWVAQVMRNWRIVCGADWTDEDLEDGGKQTVSRVVLSMLYRAATKTFHSPAILRHLFTVHAALSDFELAMAAFDSYVEIVESGKARAEKTGKHELGSDDDDTNVLTASEAIRVMCRYGDRAQGEKATETAKIVQKWLGPTARTVPGNEIIGEEEQRYREEPYRPTQSRLRQATLAVAYTAIGISQAHWGYLTYEAETRATLLAEAGVNFRKALAFDPNYFEARYALGLLSLELRDTIAAKEFLTPVLEQLLARDGNESVSTVVNASGQPLSRQDVKHLTLISHLLSLCLTTQDEYEAAAQMCEAALARAGFSRAALGGGATELTSSIVEGEISPKITHRARVDLMGGYEKDAVIEVKKSQILFVQTMEGPDAAVALTGELLALVTQLFGKPDALIAESKIKPPPTAVSHAPSRLGGTLRSIAGSIRPRSSARSTRSNVDKENGNALHRSLTSTSNGSATGAASEAGSAGTSNEYTSPIAITITNEDSGLNGKLSQRHRNSSNLASSQLANNFGPRGTQDSFGSGTAEAALTAPLHPDDEKVLRHEPSPIGAVDTNIRPQVFDHIPHNTDSEKLPPPPGHADQPPVQDVRLSEPHPALAGAPPEPLLSEFQIQRHHTSVLVGVWLFIAELHIQSEHFANAQHALGESNRLLESFEARLSASSLGEMTARTLFFKGWNRGKSVDELWADLSYTRALLCTTRDEPYKAMAFHEEALAYLPDHSASIIGLSNLLMDLYEEKLPFEPHAPLIAPIPPVKGTLINEARPPPLTRPNSSIALTSPRPSMSNMLKDLSSPSFMGPSRATGSAILDDDPHADPDASADPALQPPSARDPTPATLNLLACRDRAYMLLVALTKSGAAWNLPEAWLALARAHELSGNFARARQTLWWVVELEDCRTARSWRESVGAGGYTL